MQKGAEQSLGLADLEDGKPPLLVFVGLQVGKLSGELFLCDTIVDRNIEDFFGTARDDGHCRRV